MLKGSLGCIDNERVEFRIWRATMRMPNKFIILDFSREDFDLFSDLLGGVDRALERRVVLRSW